MSDIKDRMKFSSGTDKVTKSVADAVSEVLNSGQTPKSRYEQQAELMGYPLQDKPEVAESFTKELQELRKAVADDKRAFILKARKAKENGDIHIDTWADETEPHQLTKIKLKMTPEEEDKNANIVRDKDGNAIAVESMYGTKQESDVDVALNLQAESQRGK